MMPSPLRLSLLAAALAWAPVSAPAQAAPSDAPAPSVTAVTSVTGDDLVRTARRYLGVRYLLGGTTPRAFDCSGFVRWVFAEHGIALPRTAHEQAGVGDAPEPGDLRPGDLLFFWGGQGAQHIAMYVGGDTIIHASSRSGRVKLDRFSGSRTSPGWFGQRIIAIRRIVPLEP
jgi:peptidoglycan DL-endopeptidase CwlO